MPETSEWTSIGPHRYRIDGDCVLWQPVGEILPAQHAEFFAQVVGVAKKHGYVNLLIWGDHDVELHAEVRRNHVRMLGEHRPHVNLAIVGAKALQQAYGQLMASATRRAVGVDLPAAFFATEAEARAWFATLPRPG